MACLPEEDKDWVDEVRSFSEGRFIGDGDAEGIVPDPCTLGRFLCSRMVKEGLSLHLEYHCA